MECKKKLLEVKDRAQKREIQNNLFLAQVAHEFRTPLNGIIGFAEILQEDGLTKEEQKEYSRIINLSAKRLLTFVNDMLQVAQIHNCKLEVNKGCVKLNDLMREISLLYYLQVKEKGLKWFCNLALDDIHSLIYTDEQKLNQIITNLIGNALKFTSEGQISLGYRLRDAFLEFYVEDTGIGIPADQQDYIFESFGQVDGFASKKKGGVGFGLYISKSLVQMLGGRMWVESELGQGSTFYFTIPYESGQN
ncbi:MAG: sensor histidine kinase [Marinifilaceae bacterium]